MIRCVSFIFTTQKVHQSNLSLALSGNIFFHDICDSKEMVVRSVDPDLLVYDRHLRLGICCSLLMFVEFVVPGLEFSDVFMLAAIIEMFLGYLRGINMAWTLESGEAWGFFLPVRFCENWWPRPADQIS